MTAPYQPSPLPRFEPQAPAPSPKQKKGRVHWAFLVLTFFVGLLFGSIGGSTDEPTSEPAAAAPTYSAPAPTYSVPTYEPPAAPVEEVEAPAPAGTITNGTYEIGTEVAPGKYKSAGPESGLVSLCYVDVQRDDEYLAQEVSNDGQVRIEIKASWKGALMEVSGCQPLVKQ